MYAFPVDQLDSLLVAIDAVGGFIAQHNVVQVQPSLPSYSDSEEEEAVGSPVVSIQESITDIAAKSERVECEVARHTKLLDGGVAKLTERLSAL